MKRTMTRIIVLLSLVSGYALAQAPITDVFVDLHGIHKWDDSNGDTWDPFWAMDDSLYSFSCDGRGFGTTNQNLCFNKLTGNSADGLSGRIFNTMSEYGTVGATGAASLNGGAMVLSTAARAFSVSGTVTFNSASIVDFTKVSSVLFPTNLSLSYLTLSNPMQFYVGGPTNSNALVYKDTFNPTPISFASSTAT